MLIVHDGFVFYQLPFSEKIREIEEIDKNYRAIIATIGKNRILTERSSYGWPGRGYRFAETLGFNQNFYYWWIEVNAFKPYSQKEYPNLVEQAWLLYKDVNKELLPFIRNPDEN